MIRFPHVFIHAPWERRITGHMGFTYLFWTFVDLTKAQIGLDIHDGFKRHEQRHVQQSVVITMLAAALIALGARLPGVSLWWSLLSLLAWPLVYFVVSVVWKVRTGKGYTDNFFERDARRYEERTR